MTKFKLAATVSSLALVFSFAATVGEALPTGFMNSDRFGYSGTITRHDSLADAKSGTNATDTVTIGDRDLSLEIDNGRGSDAILALGSWWYTTDEFHGPGQGRAGWGNTRGNTGQGYIQMYDADSSTDTNVDMSFSNFDGTYYQDFNLSVTGENTTRADDFSRLSVYDNTDDGGIFHEYMLDLKATGLQGSINGGFIEALNTQPTGVSGSIKGVFELTENQTSSANQGFYNFDFGLSMTNWAWENRNDLTPEVSLDGGNSFFDGSFAESNFVAAVPVPAALPLLLTVFGGLGLAARYRRKVA